ncbi:MAG TPA: glycosyltransferase [Polyangiales bacterium]|nr:glycosyltransferase [Polyangiales bacterium]
MRVVMFYHSLVSDWNHGNAHFLRGVVSELLAQGHDVAVYEPADAWSLRQLLSERGPSAIEAFRDAYPELRSTPYLLDELDLPRALDGADLVLVHEWNATELVQRIGDERRRQRSFRLLFHDTHHRAVSAPHELPVAALRDYDGVLAFGRVLAETYQQRSWAERVCVWHEAADTRLFQPLPEVEPEADLIWIGNWGDDERCRELQEFLLGPIRELGLRATLHGVRYPEDALAAVAGSGARYRGFLPNFDAPRAFARHRVTIHVPRRYYSEVLPGIPTIRVFEALACGIPLLCAPWLDSEGLFTPGRDYLVADDGASMTQLVCDVLADRELARSLAEHGRRSIEARHTCRHRVDELLEIYSELEGT